jgi:hypothetical protein
MLTRLPLAELLQVMLGFVLTIGGISGQVDGK